MAELRVLFGFGIVAEDERLPGGAKGSEAAPVHPQNRSPQKREQNRPRDCASATTKSHETHYTAGFRWFVKESTISEGESYDLFPAP